VPKDQATFTVTWCCAAHGPGPGIYQELQTVPKYHGEISVDPDSGAITRLVFVAELESGQPVSTADITIEYGPVEIAGKTYFAPPEVPLCWLQTPSSNTEKWRVAVRLTCTPPKKS
jgi:hypothetical protein